VVKTPSFFREKPFYILIFITLLYFYRPIFLGEVFYYRDLFSHFVPKRKLVAEYISNLELPLWDPYLQGGKPLLANPNNMALYPSNLLYLFVSPPAALTIEIIFHLLAGSIAIYAFCRMLELKQTSSLIAAAIYGFCGYAFSTVNLLNWLAASACLAILFCFWHLYQTTKQKKWWLLSLIVASLQLLAGAPELTLITFVTLLVWTISYSYPESVARRMFQCILLGFFTIGICLVQILPTVEFSRSSIRSVGFGFDSATVWSLHPWRIPELIFPGILGRFDSLSSGSYWGQKLEGKTPFFLSIYFGIAAIALAVFGSLSPGRFRRARISLAVVFIVSIVLAMGRYLPGISGLFSLFSLRVPFRFPEKWLAASVLPVSILAAFGSEILFSNSDKRLRIPFWGLLLILILCLLGLSKFMDSAESIFGRAATPEMIQAFRHAVLHAILIWTLACVLYESKFLWRHQAFAALLFVDLLIAGIPLKILGPADLFTNTPQLASVVQNQLADGKFFRADNAPHYGLNMADDSLYWNYKWQQEVLDGYLASNYRIPVIFHDDLDASSLIELNYLRFRMGSFPWEKKLPVLSASGVNMILTAESINQNGLRPIAKIRNASTMQLYLYSNETAVKSLHFVTKSHQTKNATESLQYMISSDYDPANEVILNQPVASKNNTCTGAFQILEEQRSLQSRNYVIENQCDGFLVFGEPGYSGWKLSVDNRKSDLVKADVIYSAAYIEKGKHTIRKVYFPDSVIQGGLLSALFLISAFIFVKKGA
jgi:hypothetical protein